MPPLFFRSNLKSSSVDRSRQKCTLHSALRRETADILNDNTKIVSNLLPYELFLNNNKKRNLSICRTEAKQKLPTNRREKATIQPRKEWKIMQKEKYEGEGWTLRSSRKNSIKFHRVVKKLRKVKKLFGTLQRRLSVSEFPKALLFLGGVKPRHDRKVKRRGRYEIRSGVLETEVVNIAF